MGAMLQEQANFTEQEEKLFQELDKGIDDMEQGKITPHKESIQLIKERLKLYGI